MHELFVEDVKKICKKVAKGDIVIEIPPRQEFGDLAVPCFRLAQNPVKAAQDIVDSFKPTKYIERAEVRGPYVNFFVNKERRAEIVLGAIRKDPGSYGSGKPKKERVMIEFSQPNTHKGFHVGHIRNACLGDSLVKIFRRAGYPTIAANYINDTGTHVAKCLWGFIKFHKGKEPFQRKGEWLGEVYADAAKRLKENPEFMDEVYAIHQKIEADDPKLLALWEETREWCMDDFLTTYKDLNIVFDVWFFDHELIEPGKAIVKELLDAGIAKEDQGAIIVDLNDYKLDVALILKSDGTSLYITKDLALAKEKFEDHKIDRSIYVVASEQNTHFKQLFKILELLGFKQAKNCFHLPYELVMDASGKKMSSREGRVFTYHALFDDVFNVAKAGVEDRHPEWGDKHVDLVSRDIAVASIKFTMIHHDNNKTINFDPEKASQFDGETGPYCQYAFARACSVIKKSETKIPATIDFSIFASPKEQALIATLGRFPNIIEEAKETYSPSVIANFTIDLAQKFSDFYESCPILTEKDDLKKARLYLLDATRIVLKESLNLLGIPTPEAM